jgi:LacI family transcriptional regulator
MILVTLPVLFSVAVEARVVRHLMGSDATIQKSGEQRMITIREVAKLAEVSVSTVSRVINNLPDVNPQTRQKVCDVIRKHGYIPNAGAKALKQANTNIIAIVVKGTGNPFFEPIVEEIQSAIDQSRYVPLVHYIDESADEVMSAAAIVGEKKALGVIFLGGNPAAQTRRIINLEVPCVFATVSTQDLDLPNACCVCVDDVRSARMAIEYLLDRGHRAIAVLGGRRLGNDMVHRRYIGVRQSLEAHGLSLQENLYFESLFTFEDSYAAVNRALAMAPPFTALFAMSDIMAIGACKAVFDAGRRVPDDISIVGFDGIKMAAYYNPTLTTVRQPGEEIARRSADLIIRNIGGEALGSQIILDSSMVIGASVKSCF